MLQWEEGRPTLAQAVLTLLSGGRHPLALINRRSRGSEAHPALPADVVTILNPG